MFTYLLQGLSVGLAYVAPIGTQNMYVINSAMTSKSKIMAVRTALIVIFFDISLALACFFGMGILIERFPIVQGIMLFAGSLAVLYIGYNLIKSTAILKEDAQVDQNFLKIAKTCFVVTWLNPQAIIDGTLLFGGSSAALPPTMRIWFIIGVCMASALWFLSLTGVVALIKNKVLGLLKYINIICGIVIMLYGLKLGIGFINFIK